MKYDFKYCHLSIILNHTLKFSKILKLTFVVSKLYYTYSVKYTVQLTKWNRLTFCVLTFPVSDHPFHPPKNEDPFDMEVPTGVECCLKMVQGLVYVYENEEAMEKGTPLELPYIHPKTFLADQNIMYALISDGPL